METLTQDLRYVARTFVRSPGFFVVTVLTLALGIGATTAIFSVVNGVLLKPLPYPSSDRIVQIFQSTKDGTRNSFTEPNFIDVKEQSRSFSRVGMSSSPGVVTVTGLSEPTRAKMSAVSSEFFGVFQLTPEIGRVFLPDEATASSPSAVVVSHKFWTDHLGSSPSVASKTLKVGNDLMTIVGVMPRAMDYPVGTELWIPHAPDPQRSRTSGGWRAVARVKDGLSLAQAEREMTVLAKRLKEQYGDETGMFGAEVVSLHDLVVGKVRSALMILLGASAFLLLIACANVVNLLIARMTIRRSEIGLRLALGASRRRLAQQMLTEAGVLSLVGGVGGVALAALGVRLLLTMQNSNIPRATEVNLELPVLLFALAVSLVAALSLGLLTAWHGTQSDIREALSSAQRTQSGGGSGSTIRRSLVVLQMALTVVLLVGAGVLGRSFVHLLQVDPGFRTTNLVILDAVVPYEGGATAGVQRAAFYEELMERVRAIPGVSKVGGASGVPLVGGGSDGTFIIMTRPDEPLKMEDYPMLSKDPKRSGYANFMVADGNYFAAMNIPLISGRTFESSDGPNSAHVGVISASLAKEKWLNESAIGKVIQYGNMDGDLRPFTVVGVVGDVRQDNLATEPTPTFYAFQPQRTNAAQTFHIVMQTAGDPTSVMASARSIAQQLRPDVPPLLRTMETVVTDSVAERRFVLMLVGVFGAAALILATLGVYSVISYLVTQRRQEISVRIALGAQRGDVLGMVLRQGATLAFIGIAIGALGALSLTRLLKGLVYGIRTTDPLAFGGMILLLGVVALAASWLPARRATRVDPISVLRGG
ncbi:MAG: ABC transporter permease [Gemmatimonadaceae bacterium]